MNPIRVWPSKAAPKQRYLWECRLCGIAHAHGHAKTAGECGDAGRTHLARRHDTSDQSGDQSQAVV